MLRGLLYLSGFVVWTAYCDAVCRSDPKNLIMCMRPLLDTWEHIRNEESHAANLIVPVPFYTKPSIFALCNSYVATKEKCFEGDCPSNVMMSFVKSQLGFVCGSHLPLYIENYECLTSSLLKSRQCLQSIYGMPNPLNSTGQCAGLPKFFSCASTTLEKSCGRTAMGLLHGVIEQMGCENDEGLKFKEDLKKANESGQLTEDTLKDYLKRESPKNIKDLMKSKENSAEKDQLSPKSTLETPKESPKTKLEEEPSTKPTIPAKEVKLEFKEEATVAISSEKEKKAEKSSNESVSSPKLADDPGPTATPLIVTVPTSIAFGTAITVPKTVVLTTITPKTAPQHTINKNEEVTRTLEETTKKTISALTPDPKIGITLENIETATQTLPTTHNDPTAPPVIEITTKESAHEPEVTTAVQHNATTERSVEKTLISKENATRNENEPKEPRQEPSQATAAEVRVAESISVKNSSTSTNSTSSVIDFEKPMEDPKIEPLDEVLKHFKLSSLNKKDDVDEKELSKKEAIEDPDQSKSIQEKVKAKSTNEDELPEKVQNSTRDNDATSADPSVEFKSGYEKKSKSSVTTTEQAITSIATTNQSVPRSKLAKEVKQREINDVIDEPRIDPEPITPRPTRLSTEPVSDSTKMTIETTVHVPETTIVVTTLPTTIAITTPVQSTTPTETTRITEKPTTEPFVRLSQRKQAVEEPQDPKDPKEPKCTDEDVEYVSACHEKLTRRLSAFSALPSSKIRFPLFNLTSTEVLTVCKVYDQGVRCSEAQNERCRDSHILTFLNTQLEYLCFRIYSMKYDYDCMRRTYLENMHCVEKISGNTESVDKCTGQQESFDCFVTNSGCGEGATILIKEIMRGYGCRVDTKPWLTKAPTTTTRRTRKPRTTTPMPTPTNSTDEDNQEILLDGLKKLGKKVETSTLSNEFTSGTTIDDLVEANKELLETDAPSGPSIELVEKKSIRNRSVRKDTKQEVIEEKKEKEMNEPAMEFHFHGQCSTEERTKARVCVAPLLKSLILLRQWRPELTEMRFPIYKYTRGELLDLCDGYANAFLCAGHGPIRHCLKDELISFAQDHLGYQCSPQNIGRFMQHYDCIVNVEMPGPCAQFVKGEAVPGTTKVEKCNGIGAYRMCMLPLIRKSCAAGATTEFEQTIMQFGC